MVKVAITADNKHNTDLINAFNAGKNVEIFLYVDVIGNDVYAKVLNSKFQTKTSVYRIA